MPSSPPLRPLLLDLDGTLIDSRADLAAAVNALLAECGIPPLPQALMMTFVGRGARTLVTRSLEAADPEGRVPRDEQTTRRFLGHYRRCLLDNTRPYPGVLEGLQVLRSAGVPMAVVSNKPEGPTRTIVQGLGLAPFFSVVFGGDSFPTRKPEPQMLAEAAQGLGVGLHTCVMVGDSDVDAEAARRAGCPFLWCAWGGISLERPDSYEHVAPRFDAVVAVGLGAPLPGLPPAAGPA